MIMRNVVLLSPGVMDMITYEDFEKVEVRVGTIVEVKDNSKARKPAYALKIDFGKELGIKTSSAQIKESYTVDELINKKIIAVVNFEPKNVAGIVSEVLLLGVPTPDGKICLLEPVKYETENGVKVY